MPVLIIYAHPETNGFCFEILSQVENNLTKKGQNYEVIDLYAIGYDPVLKKQEHYTAGNRKISQENLEFQKKIAKTDKLIFIYPAWWNSPPAVLKGFFDRVLTPGFAYRFRGRWPQKYLKGKKAAVFLTHGSPKIYTDWIIRNRGAKVITRDTLGFCGIKAGFFKINNALKLNQKKQSEIKKKVKRGLKYILR